MSGVFGVTVNQFSSIPQPGTGLPNFGFSYQRNKLINGGMAIDQWNNGLLNTPGVSAYVCDRWRYLATQTLKFLSQAGVPIGPGATPSDTGLLMTSESSYAVAAGDYFVLQQRIEANNTTELFFGTAYAKTLTLSFWVYSSLTGTFGGNLQNFAATRCYPFSYSLTNANTWTYVTVTIPGDTAGTWVQSGTGGSLTVSFGLGCGTQYGSGVAGAWTSTYSLAPTGSVSVVGTAGATFYLSCVQLETGSSATPFEQRLYGTELMLCQRYCFSLTAPGAAPMGPVGFNSAAAAAYTNIVYPQPMRAVPTMIASGTAAAYSVFNPPAALTACTVLPAQGQATQMSSLVNLTTAATLTVAAPAMLWAATAAAQLTFSAEL